jgi:uncharacterized protein (DUF488 family)
MTMFKSSAIYTIGHSDHSTHDLIALLKRHRITCVIDVRSQPYSRWANQFNRETLAYDLQEAGLDYRFMGDTIGGRPSDPTLYDPGQEHPDYARMEQTARYQAGIDQLLALASTETVALMCSEGDHRQCHRHKLITQTLLDRDVEVRHIQADGTTVQGERIPKQLSLFD